jgi:hypothetical protein
VSSRKKTKVKWGRKGYKKSKQEKEEKGNKKTETQKKANKKKRKIIQLLNFRAVTSKLVWRE